MTASRLHFSVYFGNFLAFVLVAAHTFNNLDLSNEQSSENEGYKTDEKGR